MKHFVTFTLGTFCLITAQGALYNGNGNTSFGGAVGTGSLSLTDNGATVTGTVTRGSGSFLDVLVLFIDSKAGGYSTTSGFTDSSSFLTKAVSGIDGTGNRAIADFASGFSADYAIALRPKSAANPDQLFQLINSGAHTALGDVELTPVGNGSIASYTFSFNLSDIGLTPGAGVSFKFQSTYIGDNGSRSLESFESLTGDQGWWSVSFGTYNTYTLAPVPEASNVALVLFGMLALTVGAVQHVRKIAKKGSA
jgi:hypothetical protein